MKTTALFSSVLVAGALFASSAAMAAPHSSSHRVDIDIPKLEMRIDAGVRSGKLTSWEEHQLRRELKELRFAVKNAMKDHRISQWERKSLERKEAALKSDIFRLSNNRAVSRTHNSRMERPDFHRNSSSHSHR